MRKKAVIGSAAAGALAGVALVVFSRGGDRVVPRLRQRPDGDGPGPVGPLEPAEPTGVDDVEQRMTALAERNAVEVIAAIPALSEEELHRLQGHERSQRNRVTVLRAIDRALG